MHRWTREKLDAQKREEDNRQRVFLAKLREKFANMAEVGISDEADTARESRIEARRAKYSRATSFEEWQKGKFF